jgi:hypothetical protein
MLMLKKKATNVVLSMKGIYAENVGGRKKQLSHANAKNRWIQMSPSPRKRFEAGNVGGRKKN